MHPLAQRLIALGMPDDQKLLDRAHRIALAHTDEPHALPDIVLLTICSDAFRIEGTDLPRWV